MSRKPPTYLLMAADFEVAPYDPTFSDVCVWLWAAHTRRVLGNSRLNVLEENRNQTVEDLGMETGTDIKGFLDHVTRTAGSRKLYVYFHNLSYDVYFIVQALMLDGARNMDTWSDKRLAKGCNESSFKTFINSKEQWGRLDWYPKGLKPKRAKNDRRPHVIFCDSTAHINIKLSELGELIGRPKLKMREEDYSKCRLINYSPTPEEIAYVTRDVEILSKILDKIDWKVSSLPLSAGLIFIDGLPQFKDSRRRRASKWRTDVKFDAWFPDLGKEADLILRRGYHGGLCKVKKSIRGRLVEGPGRVYDINSLYPTILLNENLPVGEPIFYEANGLPPDGLWIAEILASFSLKPDGEPCLIDENSRIRESGSVVRLIMTSVEYELYTEIYDFHLLDVGWCFQFRGKTGLFENYVNLFRGRKEASPPGSVSRVQAKQYLNRLVGKFGYRSKPTRKSIRLDGDQWVEYVPFTPHPNPRATMHGYLPLAMFVNAYGRARMTRAIKLAGERFLYCDTDSLHVLGDYPIEELDIHDSRFGAWKLEHRFTEAFYNRPRQYGLRVLEDSGRTYDSIHLSGTPGAILTRLTLDDITHSNCFEGYLKRLARNGNLEWVHLSYDYEVS